MSVIAALAAWIAAMATARSVKEMQAARRQNALPHLDFRTRDPVTVIWNEGKVSPKVYSSVYDQVPPFIEMYNSGTGPAIDISIEFHWQKAPLARPASKVEVARILGAGGIRVKDANNGIELQGSTEKDHARFHWGFFPNQIETENCPANSSVRIEIPVSLLSNFSICVFGQGMERDGPLSWRVPATLRYRTVSDEQFKRKLVLYLFEREFGFIVGDPAENRKGIWHWSQIQADVSIDISTDYEYNPSIVAAILRHITSPLGKIFEDIRAWHRERKLDIVHFIDTGNKTKRLRVGDRVVYKNDKNWESGEFIEIPEAEMVSFDFEVVEVE